MTIKELSRADLFKIVMSRFLMAIVGLMILFFVPAWSFDFWEAWAYLLILFVPMLFALFYLLKNSPDLLARRMQFKEKETQQKLIIKLSYIPFSLAYILPGFDHRFGWSTLPLGIILMAQFLVLVGYAIVMLVFRENQYASRIVEVTEKQTVITTGPYAIVRHPMYVGTLLLYVISPLALGSFWAFIPALFIIPVIIFRILDEEKILAKQLEGYVEYMQKTRFRLIPGVW